MAPKKDKMKEDLSPLVDKQIPESISLAKSGRLKEAIEQLYSLEKQTRQAEDQISTSRVAKAIINLCFEANELNLLNENLKTLAKRRGQLRTVIQDFVGEAMTYLDKLNKEDKLTLLATLREITEGKMFVEIERARLTEILAKMKEADGNIAEAANIMQEIQVETFGQMDRKEKTNFILEQVRLCLDKKDYVRAQILSNKISKKAINEPELQDLKIKYHGLMITYFLHDRQYLNICKAYMSIYDTPKIQDNEAAWKQALEHAVVFAILSPYNNEQSDVLARISLDKKLEKLPLYKTLVTAFMTKEIINWNEFKTFYGREFQRFEIFNKESGQSWEDLQKRIVQHNLRVIAGYYSRITMMRLSDLLGLSADETEKHISDLVVSKSIYAKIDRPAGIINFTRQKNPNDFLNDWASDISRLLSLMERTSHLIDRENMVHKIDS